MGSWRTTVLLVVMSVLVICYLFTITVRNVHVHNTYCLLSTVHVHNITCLLLKINAHSNFVTYV